MAAAVGVTVSWHGKPHVTDAGVALGVAADPGVALVGAEVRPGIGVADGDAGLVADGPKVAVGVAPDTAQSAARLARLGEPQPVASSQPVPAG